MVAEVERFATTERTRLGTIGIETRFQRSPDDWLKTSANLSLDRLPHTTADLIVWDSGEAELLAGWGQRREDWDETLAEHLDLGSVDDVRQALERLISSVRADHAQ